MAMPILTAAPPVLVSTPAAAVQTQPVSSATAVTPVPAVSSAAAVAVPVAPPAVAPIVAAPAPAPAAPAPPRTAVPLEPPLREVSEADFEKFLAEAPYGRDAKDMLRLIVQKSPVYARTRVLNDVLTVFPQIVSDPTRAGAHTYSRLTTGADGNHVVVLNSGPMLYEKHKLFGGVTMFLPVSSQAYADAGLSVPALKALQADAVSEKSQSGPWGQTAVYADGSQRLLSNAQAQAGYLLAELMRLDSRLRGWDASAYVVEVVARTAQWLFYDALGAGSGGGFLDRETRNSYLQWREQPAAYSDQLLQSLAASRSGVVDPRKAGLTAAAEFDRKALSDCAKSLAEEGSWRGAAARQARTGELAAYEASGLFESERIAAARGAVAKTLPETGPSGACPPQWQSELSAMSKSAAVLGEAVETERRWRQAREAHADNP